MTTALPETPFISLSGVDFAWPNTPTILSVDRFTIGPRERVFLVGPSGSGKSSLLGIIAGVFSATKGEVLVAGQSLAGMGAKARDQLRAELMGVIFQQFNLVPYLTLVENVLLPCRFSAARRSQVGSSDEDRKTAALALLTRLGLEEEALDKRQATQLSVGQQQRVAAARALIGSPRLIIADEPTSALDSETRDGFIHTLLSEAGEAAVLFVSHDASLASHFDRKVSMSEINRAAPAGMKGAA